MNTIKNTIKKMQMFMPALALMAVLGLAPVSTAQAANCNTDSVLGGAKCAKSNDQSGDIKVVIQTVTNVLLFVIGAVAVIMIIIGGIRYTTSNGDSSQVTSAKNTILYSVVGLVVALLAYAIVNFVANAFIIDNTGNGGGRGSGAAS